MIETISQGEQDKCVHDVWVECADAAISAFPALSHVQAPAEVVERKFKLGDRVRKSKGASWQGVIVGFYSTTLTPIGYAVESEREPGSVQIYPEAALEPL